MKKIYLIGSSSGGHVFPLIGLYEFLKNEYDITFIGIKNRFEENVFPKNSIFLNIPNSFKKINKEKQKFNEEINRLKNIIGNQDLILSGGGISSYIASRIGKGKLILLEQNRILGDSNLYAGLKANKILTSIEILVNPYFYKTKRIINPSIYRIKNDHVDKEDLIVFIFGSLSSSTLIKTTIDYFLSNQFNKKYKYVLVTGNNYEKIKCLNLPKNIILYKKITDFSILKKAKLVFTRSGGTTLNELTYFKIPFISIPSPYVKHNHQEFNARFLKKKYNIPFILEKNYNKQIIKKTIDNINDINCSILWDKMDNKGKDIKEIIDELL